MTPQDVPPGPPVIGILGPVVGWSGTGEIPLGAPRERTILAALAVNAGRLVTFTELIGSVWGDQAPAGARGNLHAHVSRLRRRLAQLHDVELASLGGGYRLSAGVGGASGVDLQAFRRLADAARAEPDDTVAERGLRAALDLWRGPALADLNGTRLADTVRPALEDERLLAVEEWIERLLALHRESVAITTLRGLVGRYPQRDRLCRLLMLALYRNGQRSEALELYRDASERSVNDLGLDPVPELRNLHAAILRDDPALTEPLPPTRQATAARPPQTRTVAATAPATTGPADRGDVLFVGRRAELAELRRWLGQASTGAGRTVLIGGEPGIGKTSLAEEIALRAAPADTLVVWGGCYEGDGAPAFWPWIQAIRVLLDRLDPQELRAALGPGAGDIAQIVAEVKDLVPDIEPPPQLGPEAARFRLYEAVTRLLLRVAAHRPVVLVLDDLHWADAPSLSLLAFLTDHLRQARILVLATYRDTELDTAVPLAETLALLSRRAAVRRISLSGLGRAEVAELAELTAAATGSAPDAALIDEVHDRTGGNPFYVVELVRLLSGPTGPVRLPSPETAVPGGVRDVILRRMALLPEGATQLLGVAAVIGREFDLDVLARASQHDDERTLDLIEAAQRARLVQESPGAVGRYLFVHALIRETLYDQLSAFRRSGQHLRVGDALAELRGTDAGTVEELAQHYLLAAPAGAAAKAFDHAMLAAQLAVTRLAFEQAEELLRRALEVLARLPAGRERSRRELAAQTATVRLLTWTRSYSHRDVGTACERAVQLCRELGQPDQAGLVWSLWAYHDTLPDHDTAHRWAARLRELGGDGDAAFLTVGHLASGIGAVQQGRMQSAVEHLRQASAHAAALDDAVQLRVFGQQLGFVCRSFWSLARWQLGDERQAVAMIEDTLRLARAFGHPYSLSTVILLDTWIGLHRLDAEHVRQRAGENLALTTPHGFALISGMSMVARGWAVAELGDPAAGVAEVRRGMDSWHASGAGMMDHMFLGLLGAAHRRARDHDQALAAIEEGLADAERKDEHFYEAELHRMKGELLWEASPRRADAAVASLSRAVAVAGEQAAAPFQARAADSLRRLVG